LAIRKAHAALPAWRPCCWPCAMVSCPPPSTWTNPIPSATSITSPEPGRRLEIEHAVGNCIAFGSKNSALVLRKL
jgi:hypothetical protein